MILFFSDIHLGIRSYSTLNSNGLYTAEEDSRNALNELLERAKQPDIVMIICGGDVFHTNNPTSENIKFFIEWLHRMDQIKKPFFIIPGNHDCSTYSNSLAFVKELKLKYITLVDKENIDDCIATHVLAINYKIKFVPYIPNISNKNKDVITDSNLIKSINEAEDNTIIISHIQEQSCQVGSEGRMISRGVELLDADVYKDKNIILLLGHIHRSQIYKKGNLTVVYSGSTTYMDAGDLGMAKSYVVFTKEGEIKFESFTSIRRFVKYSVPKEQDTLTYLEMMRIPKNSVVFIDYAYEGLDKNKLYQFLKEKNCVIGNLTLKRETQKHTLITTDIKDKNPYNIFSNYTDEYNKEKNLPNNLLDNVKILGKQKIEAMLGK